VSDSEFEAIRRRKLRELRSRLGSKQTKPEEPEADTVLEGIFKGRAWEVYNLATAQYPQIMGKVRDALVKLALAGRLKEVTGEQLYLLLRNLGLKVRLITKIRYAEHGKMKSLAEKIKEDLTEA
jgi:DNA-binding TFAR19-related protein (PDSD5 family)